jgi:hypothetical protein
MSVPSDPDATGAYHPAPPGERFATGALLASRYCVIAALGRGGIPLLIDAPAAASRQVHCAAGRAMRRWISGLFAPQILCDPSSRRASSRG